MSLIQALIPLLQQMMREQQGSGDKADAGCGKSAEPGADDQTDAVSGSGDATDGEIGAKDEGMDKIMSLINEILTQMKAMIGKADGSKTDGAGKQDLQSAVQKLEDISERLKSKDDAAKGDAGMGNIIQQLMDMLQRLMSSLGGSAAGNGAGNSSGDSCIRKCA